MIGEKVDEKWLKVHGWTCWHNEVTEEYPYKHEKSIKHNVVYVKDVGNINMKCGKYKRARWEHTFIRNFIVSDSGKQWLRSTSNYYMFGAFGDKFHVENTVSNRKFKAEKIEAACKLCGID